MARFLNPLLVLVVLILAPAGFIAFRTWGIGGRAYNLRFQREVAAFRLVEYYNLQESSLKEKGHYDVALHKEAKFEPEKLDGFRIGFAETDAVIKEHCPDCHVENNEYKIAAYQNFAGDLVFVTIDNSRKFSGVDL